MTAPIEIQLPGEPLHLAETWPSALWIYVRCWLRRRWPFDRRSEGGAGWGGRERRAS